MAVLSEYTYIFVIGTFFALLDAYNNGANDVASEYPLNSEAFSYSKVLD